MQNPFMSLEHCSRFAVRKAFLTGVPQHVVITFVGAVPYTVLDDHQLLARDDVEPEDVAFTADPFDDGTAPASNVVPLHRPELELV